MTKHIKSNIILTLIIFRINISIPWSYHNNLTIVLTLLQGGVTLLLLNLSKQSEFIITVYNRVNVNMQGKNGILLKRSSKFGHKQKNSRDEKKKGSDGLSYREEYHLTPKDGDIQSQTSVLNGNPLNVTDGELPILHPVLNDDNSPIYISPLSIAFIVIPNFEAPACA